VVFLSENEYVQFYFRLFLLPLEIQLSRGEVRDAINRFSTAAFLCLSQAMTWISNIICRGLFNVPWVELRGDYSFCRYWRHCWPSLFKLSFHAICFCRFALILFLCLFSIVSLHAFTHTLIGLILPHFCAFPKSWFWISNVIRRELFVFNELSSLCRYWQNCWPSLFKLSFHITWKICILCSLFLSLCLKSFSMPFLNIFFPSRLNSPIEIDNRLITTKEMISIFPLWTFHLYIATFQWHLHVEYISLSWYDILELVVPIIISLIEVCC